MFPTAGIPNAANELPVDDGALYGEARLFGAGTGQGPLGSMGLVPGLTAPRGGIFPVLDPDPPDLPLDCEPDDDDRLKFELVADNDMVPKSVLGALR